LPRILHIIPTFERAGAEKQLLLLARGLARNDFDVHVAALHDAGFREVGTIWQVLSNRVVLAVR